MPIYEYRCAACGFQKDYLQKLSDAPLTRCPACGEKKLSKLVSAAGFQLKGKGWYATDFKEGSKPKPKPDDAKKPAAESKGTKPAAPAAAPPASK
ncbi:MAG TPA: zinc ribbon domain-containing protein [Burkholderiales bacterium]|nr:zinc ribbon domain-containing protein [Burkholderiales bacterium]